VTPAHVRGNVACSAIRDERFTTKLKNRRQELGDLQSHSGENFRAMTDWVGNIGYFTRAHVWSERWQITDFLRVSQRCQPGDLSQGVGCLELAWRPLKYQVSMSDRHGDNEVGGCGDFARQLARCEPGGVTAQLLENVCSKGMNPVTDNRAGAGARR